MKRTLFITTLAALALSLAFAYGPRFQGEVGPASQAGYGAGQVRAGAIFAGTLYDEAASLLGITADELVALGQNGKTLADVASDLGQDAGQFQAQLVSARNDAIDQAVQAGQLTEAQASMMKTRTEAVVAAQLKAPIGPNAGFAYGPASGAKALGQRAGRAVGPAGSPGGYGPNGAGGGYGYGMSAGAPGWQSGACVPQGQQNRHGGWR
ncbi:MAG: hypothetical protein P8Y02_06450 [Deinococcales bacterium]